MKFMLQHHEQVSGKHSDDIFKEMSNLQNQDLYG